MHCTALDISDNIHNFGSYWICNETGKHSDYKTDRINYNLMDFTYILPHEICLKIFSYVDTRSLINCSVVCKSWYKISRDPWLFKQLLISSPWSSLSFNHSNSKCFKCLSKKENIDLFKNVSFNWYDEYKRQYLIRRNWLKGRYKQRIFTGHTSVVSCVVFNEERIISGSADSTIRVWNLHTNAQWSVQTLYGHSQAVRCLQLLHCIGNYKNRALKPTNGSIRSHNSGSLIPQATRDIQLVSGSNDYTIKIWALKARDDWSSIVCRATLIGHTHFVRCLQADHEIIVSGSYDCTLKIWCTSTGKLLNTLRGHQDAILCLQYDENILVSGSLDKTIKMWNFSGDCLGTLSGHCDSVACLHLNYHNNRIISGSHDNTLRLWHIPTQNCIRTINWMESEGHHRLVRCLEADKSRFVSGSDDKTIKVWNLEDGKRLHTFHGHTDGVSCLQFNNDMLVSGSYDHTVILWDFTVC